MAIYSVIIAGETLTLASSVLLSWKLGGVFWKIFNLFQ